MFSPARSSRAAFSKFNVARWACCAGGGAVLITGLLVGTSSAAATGQTTIEPSADSWVSASRPTVNHGTTGYLQVDAAPVLRAYVRFTVPVDAKARVSRAVLTLTPNQSSSAGIIVRTASSSWTETGLTYQNAPAPSATVSARSGALTADVPVQLDVTSAVPASGGPITIVLENASQNSFSVGARERGASGPSLQITTNATTSSKLSWAPPALSKPVTYRVSGDGPGTIEAAPGQDSIVVFDGPVHRRIRMDGGRHWIIRGGEIDNDKQWADIEDHAGLQFRNVTGTAFVEGVLIHGKYGKDGIRVAEGGSSTTLVVQNSRIVDRLSGPTGYHADVIQPFGGVKALKVDRMTGAGDYQGQMWKQEPGTTFGPTDFRRVNYRASTPTAQYMINFVMSSPTQPVTLTEVYNEPDPAFVDGDFCRAQLPSATAACATDANGRQNVNWSGTRIAINGRVTQGRPAGGDFVPAGVAGLGYESPGYR